MTAALKVFAADFETTTDPEDCRVWAYGWAAIDTPDTVHMGNDLLEFMQAISRLGSSIVYFHNLKFDGTFIIWWLLSHGYVWTNDRSLNTKEFTTLYSRMGNMYSLRVQWSKTKATEFRDSAKKFPLPLAEVAGAFGLDVKKGELDYETYREPGHELTPEERDYLHNDVSILAHALKQTYEHGQKKLTAGADALDEFKSVYGRKQFRRTFPLISREDDKEIRLAYRGGYTYADERFKGKRLKTNGVVLDVNSLYPHIMYSRALPYGLPMRFAEEPPADSSAWLCSITFTARLKKNHLPIIQLKNNFRFGNSEYIKVIDEPVTQSVTNIDWKLYNEHYDIEVYSFNGGFTFKTETGFFDTYLDKWKEIKENSSGGKRFIAKLMMNSLYGKFATSPDVTSKAPDIGSDGQVVWITQDEEVRDPIYTAMGVFITSYARELTIRAAQKNYSTFAYADTDSLHLLQESLPEDLDIDPNRLGAWDHECSFSEAFYMRAKGYIEQHSDKCHCKACKRSTEPVRTVRVAGLPTSISSRLTFDDFYDKHVIHGKLVPRNVPGGVVLVDSPYELKM